MQLVIDHWVLMRWIPHIMAFSSNQPMTQGFMRCFPMSTVKWTRSRCSTRPELVVLELLKTQAKEDKIRHKWEILCIMATSWKTSDKAMLDNKMWIISKHSSTMEDSHLTKWTTRTSPTRAIETEPAPSASTQVGLAATELVQPTVLPKIIKLTCSTWWTRGKRQMEIRITNNKWWWQRNSSSIQRRTTTRWSQAWTPLPRTPPTPTRTSRRLPKPNYASKGRTAERAIQFNMRTACLFKAVATTRTWMPQSISTITERGRFKAGLPTLRTSMRWMPPWILATSREAMAATAMPRAATIQP